MSHPIVGVWTVEARETGRPRVERATYACHADGILSFAGTTYSAHGTWTPTGPTTVAIGVLLPTPEGEGFDGWMTMRATLELTADAAGFGAQAMLLRPTPSGTPVERSLALVGRRVGA